MVPLAEKLSILETPLGRWKPLSIKDKLKARGLLYWKVGGLRALKYLIGVVRCASPQIKNRWHIAHQRT
jgi:hypothetical protein